MNAPEEPLRVSTCPACGSKPLFEMTDMIEWRFKLSHYHPVCRLAPMTVYHRDARKAAKRMATELCDKWIRSKVLE